MESSSSFDSRTDKEPKTTMTEIVKEFQTVSDKISDELLNNYESTSRNKIMKLNHAPEVVSTSSFQQNNLVESSANQFHNSLTSSSSFIQGDSLSDESKRMQKSLNTNRG